MCTILYLQNISIFSYDITHLFMIMIINMTYIIFYRRLQSDPPTGIQGAPLDNNIMVLTNTS